MYQYSNSNSPDYNYKSGAETTIDRQGDKPIKQNGSNTAALQLPSLYETDQPWHVDDHVDRRRRVSATSYSISRQFLTPSVETISQTSRHYFLPPA